MARRDPSVEDEEETVGSKIGNWEYNFPCWVQLQQRTPVSKGKGSQQSSYAKARKVFGYQLISIPRMKFPHPWPTDVVPDPTRADELTEANFITLHNLQELVMKSIYKDQFNAREVYRKEVSMAPRLPSLHFRFITEDYGHSLGDVVLRNDNDVCQVFGAADERLMRYILIATWTKHKDAGSKGDLQPWDVANMPAEEPEDVDYSNYVPRPQML